MEANPGLIGQVDDSLGPEYRRELAKHAWQAPGRNDRHHHLGISQNLGGLVGLKRHRSEGGGERVAAMPQPSG